MLPPAVNSSRALKFPRHGARGIPPPLSFRRSAAEPRNLSSNGTRRNEAGDLGAQSLNSTDTTLAIPACSPARDDRAEGSVKGNTFPPYARHPERQRKISVSMVSKGKGSQYQWAGRRVPDPDMTSRVIHGMYRDSSPAAQNDRRGGKEARVDTGAAPCRQFKRSPEIPLQWRTRHSTSTVISTVGSGVEKSHSSIACAALRRETSRLCVNSTDTSPVIPACIPARDDRAAGSVKGNTFPPYTRHPERQRRISVSMVSEGKGSQYQWAGRRVPGTGMTGSRVTHGRYRDSSPAAQNDRRAGRSVPGPGMTGSRVIHGMYQDSSPAAQNDRRAGRKISGVLTTQKSGESFFRFTVFSCGFL